MTSEVRDALAAHRKFVILEYAEVVGNVKEVCREASADDPVILTEAELIQAIRRG